MNDFNRELERRLDAVREQALYRELRRVDSAQGPRIKIGGQTLLNFSSNDYLGLANHPALKAAAIGAVEKFGAGAGASRLISGSLAPFHELEDALADFKGAESALTFSTGYATALGTICSLVGRDDVLILDKLVHASIVDAAKLSGATLRVFRHNDLNDLEAKLKAMASHGERRPSASHILIITESIFSMDGDAAPLKEMVELKDKYGGWLMVDEAHATGVVGENGRGLAAAMGVSDRIEVQMGTLGKALGASGGFICGPRSLARLLVNRARSFIFSTAPVPAAVAAARAGVEIARSAEGEARRQHLRARLSQLPASSSQPPASILPIILGNEDRAVQAAAQLRERGIFVPAIRYPAVARGAARLRVTLTAAHTAEDVARLAAALDEIIPVKS